MEHQAQGRVQAPKIPAAAAPAPAAATTVPAGPAVIECRDPATGELLGTVPAMDGDEVRARVRRARAAQVSWARTSFEERRRLLRRLLGYILDRKDEICRLVSREAGKTLENVALGELLQVCEKLRHTIAHGEDFLRPERVSSGLLVHKVATIEYHPLGVMGVITPWNFPFQNILGPTIPALMAGNGVVVKVSEWSSHSAGFVTAMFDELLREAGQDPDLFQIVTGYGDAGAALCTSGVDKIFFTGSMQNGKRVMAQCAETLTPVVLELGGKDPMIVCDDADLEQAVAAALAGVFICSGQMCLAAERLYVFEGIHDQFVTRVADEARALRQGPPLSGAPTDVGAMTMPRQVDHVERLVKDAIDKGAKVLCGGKRRAGGGQFFEPTVLANVDHRMAIMREETFGPVMAICKVSSEEEAVRLANDTEYGLGSTVLTRDPARARRIADQLVTGATCVNDFAVAYMANDLPFGGVRGSGFGRLNGREGIRACTNVKSVIEDRFPVHRPTRLYPVKPGDYQKTLDTLELVFSGSAAGRKDGGAADRLLGSFLRRARAAGRLLRGGGAS